MRILGTTKIPEVQQNFPLYCPKCKQETLIEARNLQITVITEPDAQPMNV
ncbi:cysteine-rich KTR domain-containing protein [uncultured Acetatifactor sp.]|nr:cysteine-rich KTR domain-containing protein [uncultured Acetatifactor sp.]